MLKTGLESVGEIDKGRTKANVVRARSLSSIQVCTMNFRGDKSFNRFAAQHTFRGIHEALGYEHDEAPVVAIQSMPRFDNGEPMVYAPLEGRYTVEGHIAGLTGMIAGAPASELSVADRGELIARLISDYGEGMYDGNNTRMSPRAISKITAIRTARNELSALADIASVADDTQSFVFYEGIRQEVTRQTDYHLRVGLKIASAVAAFGLVTKLVKAVRS